MIRLSFKCLMTSSMLAASALLPVPQAQAQGGVVELEGACMDAAARQKIRGLQMQQQHEQHMLDAERRALEKYTAELPVAEAEVQNDLKLIGLGAKYWPDGVNPQLDLSRAQKRVDDLNTDIQLSSDHIVELEQSLDAIAIALAAMLRLPPCPEPQPQIGLTTPPEGNPPPPPPPPWPPGVDQVHYGPNGTTFEHHTDGSTVIKGPDGNVVGLIPPPLQQPPNQPPKPGTTPEHKTVNIPFGDDEPQTPKGGKTETGKVDTPPAPAKPTTTPSKRNEQAVIDALKAQTVPGHTEVKPGPEPKPNSKPGLVTPQELKTTTLTQPKTVPDNQPKTVTRTEPQLKTITHGQPQPTTRTNAVTRVEPPRTQTRFANPGPAVAHGAPQSMPNMRVNSFRPVFSPAAPRPGGFAMGRVGGFGRVSRDAAPTSQPAPASDQTEEKPAEQPK
jgi:hypothetical protein